MSVVALVLFAGVCCALQWQWLSARRAEAKAKTRSGCGG
jgi:hypothetical protein